MKRLTRFLTRRTEGLSRRTYAFMLIPVLTLGLCGGPTGSVAYKWNVSRWSVATTECYGQRTSGGKLIISDWRVYCGNGADIKPFDCVNASTTRAPVARDKVSC